MFVVVLHRGDDRIVVVLDFSGTITNATTTPLLQCLVYR